jgi:DNA-directed RNA polymerase sigma subunit (sigma70/sigma32)
MTSLKQRLNPREKALLRAMLEHFIHNQKYTIENISRMTGISKEAINKIKRQIEKENK